jgi:GntR family transcriptional regulator/MocR family aminotransferase
MLDAEGAQPLHRQIYDHLRTRILAGELAARTVLPSSRALAVNLRVSRNTVVMAYEWLRAEGYVTSQPGSGTKVNAVAPELLIQAGKPNAVAQTGEARYQISRRAEHVVRLHALNGPSAPRAPRAFRNDAPPPTPFRSTNRIARLVGRQPR